MNQHATAFTGLKILLRHLCFMLVYCGSILACICGDRPSCTKVTANAVVFVGTPLNAAHTSTGTVEPVRFKIERVFTGLPPETQYVEIHTAAGTSCEAVFAQGTRYVVYAEDDPTARRTTGVSRIVRRGFFGERWYAGTLFTSACSGSKTLGEAAYDIRFLEAWKAHKTTSMIYGEVFPDAAEGDSGVLHRAQERLAGSAIQALAVGRQQYRAVAATNGGFLISPVPAGTYTLSVEHPKFRSSQPQYEVIVPEGGCGYVLFAMSPDGHISGRIREPDGTPPSPITIQLIPVVAEGVYAETLETTSGTDGRFAFLRVPPARFLLAVNATQEPTAKNPYKRTFYPGVDVRGKATVIELAEAASTDGLNFAISAKLKPRTIAAQVVWTDGSPARFVHIWCAPSGYTAWQHLLTDGDGRISFKALDGLDYELGAAAATNYEIVDRRGFSAAPARVAQGSSASVRLILSKPPKF